MWEFIRRFKREATHLAQGGVQLPQRRLLPLCLRRCRLLRHLVDLRCERLVDDPGHGGNEGAGHGLLAGFLQLLGVYRGGIFFDGAPERAGGVLRILLCELLLALPVVNDLLCKRRIPAVESDKKARRFTADKSCATTREQHDQLDCGVDVPSGRGTLPATREFEVSTAVLL